MVRCGCGDRCVLAQAPWQTRNAQLVPAPTVVAKRPVRRVLGCDLQWPAAQLLGDEHLCNRPRAIALSPGEKAIGSTIRVLGLHVSCESLCISVFHAFNLRPPHA